MKRPFTEELAHTLRGMPPVLIALVLGFLFVPIFSLKLEPALFWRGPADLATRVIWAFCFWILPVSIAYALVLKHHLLLPFYLIQCAFFLAVSHFVEAIAPEAKVAAQRFLVASMLYLGLFFGNKNLLYPFLMKSSRLWRRSARFDIGRRVMLLTADNAWVSGVLNDASASGLAVTVPLTEYHAVLNEQGRGARFHVWIKADEGLPEFKLPAELVWKAETRQGEGKLGCRSLDMAMMKDYLKAEPTKRAAQIPFHELSDDFALEQDVQQIALVLWVLCIAITISFPST